jgi:hypothetical protein
MVCPDWWYPTRPLRPIRVARRKRTEQELLEKQKLLQTMIETPTPLRCSTANALHRLQPTLADRLSTWQQNLKGLSHYEVFPKSAQTGNQYEVTGALESRGDHSRSDGLEDVLRWVCGWQRATVKSAAF